MLERLCAAAPTDESAELMTELGMDSLGMVTLLVELEDTLGIELEASDMDPFALRTAGDVVRLAEKYRGNDR